MGSLRRALEGLLAWMEDRAGALSVLASGRKLIQKPVPRGLSWVYTLGSLAMALFAVQFLTGFLLLAHYAPDAATAYRSVEEIQNRVPLGWLVRQMHSWGASFLVAVLLFHMLKVLWYGGYKRPREFTWFLGVLLLFVTLAFCFTGYLLPWNQLARWATAVGTDALVKVPVVGPFLGGLVRGGPEVSGQTLGRFFAVHVFLLPVVLSALLWAHLALVGKHGISTRLPVSEERALGYAAALERAGGAEPFFPRQFYRDLLVVNLGFGALVCAATFWPWELGAPAAEDTPPGIKPEWYFLPVYQFLKYFDAELLRHVPFVGWLGGSPEVVGILIVNLAGAALLLLPLLDRGNERRIFRRPVFAAITGVSLAAVVGLGFLGHLSGRTVEILGGTYRFSGKGYPERVASGQSGEGGAQLLASNASPANPPAASVADPSPPTGAAGAPLSPAEAAAGQCGQCHRHERQLREWKTGVHAKTGGPDGASRPASLCVDCHGGDSTKSDEDEAHKGILSETRRGKVRARRPVDDEVVEICGKCHSEVKEVFSRDHLGLEPAKACSGCHSNHRILPAGIPTFEEGYKEGDPRAERFLAIRGRAVELEGRWELYQKAIGGLREALRAREVPLSDHEEDLTAASNLRREARILTHSLDPDRVAKATQAALDAMTLARRSLEDRLAEIERRKYLAAAVGTVSLVFAAMLAAVLWRLRGSQSPASL